MKKATTNKLTMLLIGAAVMQSLPNWINSPTLTVQIAAHKEGSTSLSSRSSDVRTSRSRSYSGTQSFDRNGVDVTTSRDSFEFSVGGSVYKHEYDINQAEIIDVKEELCDARNITKYVSKENGKDKTVTLKPIQAFKENESKGRFFEFDVEGASRSLKKDLRTEFKITRNAQMCERTEDSGKPKKTYHYNVKTDHPEGRSCNVLEDAHGVAYKEEEMREKIEAATKAINDCMLDVAFKIAENAVYEKYAKDIATCKVRLVDPYNALAGIIRYDSQSILTSSYQSQYTPMYASYQGSAQSYQQSGPQLRYSTLNPSMSGRYNSMRGSDAGYDLESSLASRAECFLEQLESSDNPSKTKSAFNQFLNQLDMMINHDPSKRGSTEAQQALKVLAMEELEGKIGARVAAMEEYSIARDRLADLFRTNCKTDRGIYLCPIELQQEVAGYCVPNYAMGQMECDGGLLGYTQQIFSQASREDGIRGNSGIFNQYMSKLTAEAQTMIYDPNAYAKYINPNGGPIINPSEMNPAYSNISNTNLNSGNNVMQNGNRTLRSSGGQGVAPQNLQQLGNAQAPNAPMVSPKRI
jgi:hypothetical protein